MKVQQFEILLKDAAENSHAVYKSGQSLTCRIHLNLLERVKCRAINVRLFGRSDVSWTETHYNGENTVTHHYWSHETYVDETVSVFSPETTGPNAEHHPAGEFYYPVTFQLPATAPSSFEGGHGKIRYFIKASFDRPWKFDKYTQTFFTVIRDLDLNTRPAELTGPFSTSDHFSVNCCRCFSCCFGQVHTDVALNKKAFVPGEQVHVTGEIRNTSKTDLKSVSLEIYQRCVYRAMGRTKTDTRVAASTELPGVSQGETIRLDHLIPVGPLPSSHIEGCKNITVMYFMRLFADGGCCVSMREECCELLVGTVPLKSLPMSQLSGGSFGGHLGPMGLVPPPPSYETCAFGLVQMDKEEGRNVNGPADTQWAPSYPVYSRFAAPPLSQVD